MATASSVGSGAAGAPPVPTAAEPPDNIHAAVTLNDEGYIKRYVSQGGDLEVRDKDALTPLHVAAAGGFENVVEYLAKQGAR